MPITGAVYCVMLNAKEESNLYEVPEDLLHVFPDAPHIERVSIASSTYSELVAAGQINLWTADWLRKAPQLVPPEEVSTVLGSVETWRWASETKQSYVFALLTDAGLETWLSTDWRSADPHRFWS